MVTGSLIVQLADGSHRNRLLWARPDGEMLHYDKRHLFRMAGEHEHYSPGERQELFELKGWRVRPLICYDLRFPVWSRDPHDTDLLLYTANWPAPRRQHWNRLLPARAIENLCYVVAVNRIGEDGNALRYAGIARPWTSRATACSTRRTPTACSASGWTRRHWRPIASASRPTWTRIASKSILECRNVRFRSMSEAMTRRCA